MYLNKAFIIGNLTRDPEVRAMPSGGKVTTISIATNRVWKDKNGVKQENTDYHSVVIFGAQAETVERYLKKGSSAFVEGRIQTRSWDGPDGQKKYKTEIVAERVQFGPRREGSGFGGGASSAGAGAASGAATEPVENKAIESIEYPSEEIDPNDIPF